MKADKFNQLVKPGDHVRWQPKGWNDYWHVVIVSEAHDAHKKTWVRIKQLTGASWLTETSNIIIDKK